VTTRRLDRRGILRVAGVGGLGLVAAGGRIPLARAAGPNEQELAYANFAIAAELLMQDFYAKALAARIGGPSALGTFTRAAFNEKEHATAVAALLRDAGQSAPGADDFAFNWPAGTFGTLGAAAKAGMAIETAVTGAYVAATTTLSEPAYRALFASMLASEAAHVSALAGIARGRALGNSFPAALDLEAATDALNLYFG
jgi:ferritin-like protein